MSHSNITTYLLKSYISCKQTKHQYKQQVLFDCRKDVILKRRTSETTVLLKNNWAFLNFVYFHWSEWHVSERRTITWFGEKITRILEILFFLFYLILFSLLLRALNRKLILLVLFSNTVLFEDFDKLCNDGFSPQ